MRGLSSTNIFTRKLRSVNLRFFRVEDYSGELKNLVFQQIKWVPIKELMQMDFLDGDLPIVRKLVSSYGRVTIRSWLS